MSTGKPGEMIPFTPYAHDVRIQRGKHIFYVRGVRSWEPLARGSGWPDLSPGGFVIWLAVKTSTGMARRRSEGWKVGVLRYRAGKIGGPIRVVRRERLTQADNPTTRIEELVKAVESGQFDT